MLIYLYIKIAYCVKILFTVNKYNPNFDGVQFVTNYLAEGLVKKGHEVTILTSIYTRIPSSEEEIINGVKVIRKKIVTKHTFHFGNKEKYRKDYGSAGVLGDANWFSLCLDKYGAEFIKRFVEFLDEVPFINCDMHSENYGFRLNKTPCLIDFSDWCECE